MTLKIRATYREVSWPDDSEDYDEESGWCHPDNPWGGFDSENPQEVECTVSEAVHYVLDFPGGVWDYQDFEFEQDFRTGVWRQVTLHIPDDRKEQIFKWADIIQRINAKRKENRGSYY